MLARPAGAGVVVRTLEDLAGDPGRNRKLYDLVWEVRQDLPDLDAPLQEPFAAFVAARLQHPDLAPGGYFIATRGDAYLGYIYHLRESTQPDQLHIGQLGVARAWRGQGLAHALKIHSLVYAQAQGYRRLHTDNDAGNQPILSINERLGFVRKPAWLHLLKVLGQEP